MLAFIVVVLILVSSTDGNRPSLSNLWLGYKDGPVMHRWLEFADTYQEFLEGYKFGAQRLVMLEIGVQSGGSMRNWVNWFNDVTDFVYVGLDLNPLCQQLDTSDDDSTHIEIGSQLDLSVLDKLCTTYGPFDVIIDDGGHTAEMMAVSMRALFPCLSDNGFYFIEDMMTMATNTPYYTHYMNQTIVDYLAGMFTTMHNFWRPEFTEFIDPVFSGLLKSIQLVDSMAVLERSPMQHYKAVVRGDFGIPYDPVAGLQYFTQTGKELLNINIYVADNSSHVESQLERILTECRALCEQYPYLVKANSTVEQCAERMKEDAIFKVFQEGVDWRKDSQLQVGGEELELYLESLGSLKHKDRLVLLQLGSVNAISMNGWIERFANVKQFVFVGFDTNPLKVHLDLNEVDSIHVETSRQLDDKVLSDLCTKYGPFDVIVDTGILPPNTTVAALKSLFPCMAEEGLYIVQYRPSPLVDWNPVVKLASDIFTYTHCYWQQRELYTDPVFSGKVKSIQMMENLIVIERALVGPLRVIGRGDERIPMSSTAGVQFRLESGEILNIKMDVSGHSSTIPHESIKAQCIEICAEYPTLRNGLSIEECAKEMKMLVIATGFWGEDSYLFGDEPPDHNLMIRN